MTRFALLFLLAAVIVILPACEVPEVERCEVVWDVVCAGKVGRCRVELESKERVEVYDLVLRGDVVCKYKNATAWHLR